MLQSGIFNELKNDPALSILLTNTDGGFNIFPIRIPNELTLSDYDNYITYSVVSKYYDRNCGYSVTTVQINAISNTYDAVQSLADNITRVLNHFLGNLGGQELIDRTYQVNQFEFLDPDTDLYFIPIDIKFINK